MVDGVAESREVAHLPFKKKTYEDYVGRRALEKLGKKRWRKNVEEIVTGIIETVKPHDLVIGGGNAKKLKKLPKGCRLGNNANAFIGGFRLWNSEETSGGRGEAIRKARLKKKKKGRTK